MEEVDERFFLLASSVQEIGERFSMFASRVQEVGDRPALVRAFVALSVVVGGSCEGPTFVEWALRVG